MRYTQISLKLHTRTKSPTPQSMCILTVYTYMHTHTYTVIHIRSSTHKTKTAQPPTPQSPPNIMYSTSGPPCKYGMYIHAHCTHMHMPMHVHIIKYTLVHSHSPHRACVYSLYVHTCTHIHIRSFTHATKTAQPLTPQSTPDTVHRDRLVNCHWCSTSCASRGLGTACVCIKEQGHFLGFDINCHGCSSFACSGFGGGWVLSWVFIILWTCRTATGACCAYGVSMCRGKGYEAGGVEGRGCGRSGGAQRAVCTHASASLHTN